MHFFIKSKHIHKDVKHEDEVVAVMGSKIRIITFSLVLVAVNWGVCVLAGCMAE